MSNSKKNKSESFCVYLGPTILNVIQHGTVYPGKKSDVIKQLQPVIGERPKIAELIIPDTELVEARTKVITPGNPLYRMYQRIAKN